MKTSVLQFKFVKTTLIWTFLLGVVFTSCSKKDSTPPPVVDKSTLQLTVTASQTLYDGTVEGTKPNQYEVGSRTAFKTVLDAAKAVLADAAATQTAVTNANAQQRLLRLPDTVTGTGEKTLWSKAKDNKGQLAMSISGLSY